MEKIKYYISLLGLVLIYNSLLAQTEGLTNSLYPQIGKPCPDFQFKEVVNGEMKTLSLNDLKGQRVILDFWSRWCTSCIASFPKLNKLQKEFNGELKIILIGRDDKYIRPLFQKLAERYDLKLPCAFDSLIFDRFGVKTVPHLIWIGSDGLIKAITLTEPLVPENLEKFSKGIDLNLAVKSNKSQLGESASYDRKGTFMINGNGGADSSFLFRSLLTNWNRTLPLVMDHHFATYLNRSNEVFVSGAPLNILYEMAYNIDSLPTTPQLNGPSSYGKFWSKPILELADSSKFQYGYESLNNVFCYHLKVNKRNISRNELQKIMQNDLKNYFGYMVTVEKRIMPYWKLIKISGYKNLKTEGGEYINTTGLINIKYQNVPLNRLIAALWSRHQSGPPFIDETNLPWNIDLNLENVALNELEDVKEALRKNGLDLVKSEKETLTIVIRDAKM